MMLQLQIWLILKCIIYTLQNDACFKLGVDEIGISTSVLRSVVAHSANLLRVPLCMNAQTGPKSRKSHFGRISSS